MAAKRKALDELISLMEAFRDSSIFLRQEHAYQRLKKEDKERVKKPKARIPQRFKGDIRPLINDELVQTVYLNHQKKDDTLEKKIETLKASCADHGESSLFANTTKTGVCYEHEAYVQLTKDTSSDYSVLKSLITGPKAGYSQSGLGKVSTRLDLIERYFGDGWNDAEKTLTREEAEDLRSMLKAKTKSSYWRQTESENGYIARANIILDKIQRYVDAGPVKKDTYDLTEFIFGKEIAGRYAALAPRINQAADDLVKKLKLAKGNSSDSDKESGVRSLMKDLIGGAMQMTGTSITEGLDPFDVMQMYMAQAGLRSKHVLQQYGFKTDNNNISILTDAIDLLSEAA
jgi:DNA-binding winged helix-turn-helix (wHTH) protein